MKYINTKYHIDRFISIVLFLLIFGSNSHKLAGQVPAFKTHALPGLLNNSNVNLIFQDHLSFIWVGTKNGLFRYDGMRFAPYLKPDTLSNDVSALFMDDDGTLWIGYQDGSIYYKREGPELLEWMPEEGVPNVPIRGFQKDYNRNLWIATYGEGLYVWNGIHLYNFNTDDGLPGNDLYAMEKDLHGGVWVATDNGISKCEFNHPHKNIVNLTTDDGVPDEIVRTLLADHEGNLWIGTQDKGFCKYHIKQDSFEYYPINWEAGVIISLAYFQHGELWLGTEGDGLFRYDTKSNKLTKVSDKNRFEGAKIYDLLKDVEGNIWVLSNTEGICSANRHFEFESGTFSSIQTILADNRNRIWLGTPTGVFEYKQGNIQQPLRQHLPDLPLNIISLYQDKYDNLWLGTFGDGVVIYNPNTGNFRRIYEKYGLANGSILSIDGINGQVWLATLGGVTQFNTHQNPLSIGSTEFKNLTEKSGLGTNFIYRVFIDSKGRTWFGTDGKGISVLEEGQLKNYSEAIIASELNAIQKDTIELDAVYSITEDRQGNIWFSNANNGLFKFDGNQFDQLTLKEGIRDLSITSLVTDEKGNIIIVHPKGIDVLQPENGHLIYYGNEVGIQNLDPNLNAVSEDRFGQVWIADQDQLIRYTPLKENVEIHPRTILTSVSVFFEDTIYQPDPFFTYRQNNLIFNYTGLWYTHPESVKYKYKIEGLDPEWIISKDPRAVYSNLPPGEFTFMVASTENDAFNGEPVSMFSFTIQSPIWTQWWFILMTVLLLAGMGYTYIKLRDRRVNRINLLEKEKVESQFEALKSQINPHFLFNSFNTLITIIDEDPELAIRYVENFSDFFRSIIQYREKSVIDLKEEITLIQNYTYLLKKRYGENLILNIDVNEIEAQVAPLTIQMLVENAVKHNIISKAKPLTIDISISDQDYIMVRNNLQPKLTDERSTGFGLQNIINRYQLLIDRKVKIQKTDRHFVVAVPLIK